ncbi:hypothetical protein I6F53_07385 [Pseudoalteromonas sp. SWN29]|uniref:hypothetical protein n=1 Tax=Pseudoalteromonas sp. SWN29 TaxID=2792064 RepID=UPI0018CED684|nr:hypothetical protein [Pseudoalteromonas sp. SWN29]MBH0026804.1 hypothetical protein [Pseudoalteromonas sp. SWN29]
MHNTLVDFCIILSWLLLVLSTCLIIFSKYKHTCFKQRLFRFLNSFLVFQLAVVAYHFSNEKVNGLSDLSISYWVLITMQVTCNVVCYMSVKRRKAKIKPSLDSFSMD